MNLPAVIRRGTHSAITAYLILSLGVTASFVRSQQINAHGRHLLCVYSEASWKERDAIVTQLTEHAASLPAGFDVGLTGTALKTLIARGNARKDRERANLLRLQGPKPRC